MNSSPFPVAMTKGFHLFPFRTQQLSPSVPKVLGWTRPGRIGRCRIPYRSISVEVLLFFIAGDGIARLAQPSSWLCWARHCRPGRIGRCRIPYRSISVEVLLFLQRGVNPRLAQPSSWLRWERHCRPGIRRCLMEMFMTRRGKGCYFWLRAGRIGNTRAFLSRKETIPKKENQE